MLPTRPFALPLPVRTQIAEETRRAGGPAKASAVAIAEKLGLDKDAVGACIAGLATAIQDEGDYQARTLAGNGKRFHSETAKNFRGPAEARRVKEPLPRASEPLWTRDEPVRIGPKKEPLTFSHDTEVPLHNVVETLRSDPGASKALDGILAQLALPMTTLESLYGLSAKQVQAFALRRNVARPPGDTVPLHLLNPRYLQAAINKALGPTQKSDGNLSFTPAGADRATAYFMRIGELFIEALKRHGVECGFHLDGSYGEGFVIELTHLSSDEVPSRYRRAIRALNRVVEHAQSQPHLGIPTSAMSRNQARTIAAAIEARIVLQCLAVTWESEARLVFSGSLFGEQSRGIVKLAPNTFREPVPAHDLEIRKCLSIDHAMDLVAMAAQMASEPDRLEEFVFLPRSHSEYARFDSHYGSVTAALRFVANNLMRSENPHDRSLAGRALELAEEVDLDSPGPSSFKDLSRGCLRKVHDFLNETGFADYARAETFLLPTGPAAGAPISQAQGPATPSI